MKTKIIYMAAGAIVAPILLFGIFACGVLYDTQVHGNIRTFGPIEGMDLASLTPEPAPTRHAKR